MTKSIVLTACEEFGVTPEEFFGPARHGKVTHVRRVAIERFVAAGFTLAATARMIRRSYTTVQYWMHAEYRARRTVYYEKYRADNPPPRTRGLRKLRREERERLLSVYLTRGVQAATPLALAYGVHPTSIRYYARKIGHLGKPGRPRSQEARP